MELFKKNKEKVGKLEEAPSTASSIVTSMTAKLRALAVGESVAFPLTRLYSVRTKACEMGAIEGKTYTTAIDRENKIIKVTRTA